MAKMNSTSLYTTTNQIILNANVNNPSSWQDLYRLVPYLRNSLSCVVCGNLLVDPQTPEKGRCQHHLCRNCRGGRKKIKPACVWCRDCVDYKSNTPLRILLQCYKQMCTYLINSDIFKGLLEQASAVPPLSGVERGAGNLILLIKEGTEFQDDYESIGGLPRSAYSILPCVYTNSSTQTLQLTAQSDNSKNVVLNPADINNIPPLYSVMVAGTGNKITIKRKPKEVNVESKPKPLVYKREASEKPPFKRPTKTTSKPKKGCRCGNATATPGKLTCCGQRCPCYVDSKACIECKCRGCRNPHTPDGQKVRVHLQSPISQIPQLLRLPHNIDQLEPDTQVQVMESPNLKLDNITNIKLEQVMQSPNLKLGNINNIDVDPATQSPNLKLGNINNIDMEPVIQPAHLKLVSDIDLEQVMQCPNLKLGNINNIDLEQVMQSTNLKLGNAPNIDMDQVIQSPNLKLGNITNIEMEQVMQSPNLKLGNITNIEVEPQYTFDTIGFKTYKVVTNPFNGLTLPANFLLNGPILDDEDDITVDL